MNGDELNQKLWDTYNALRDVTEYSQMAERQRFASATVLSLLYEFLDDKTTSDAEFRAYMKFTRIWFRDNEDKLLEGV